MAARRKDRKAPRGRRGSPPEPPKETSTGATPPEGPKCWLCSKPLAAGTVASVLGPGMFEVHQRCYEQAMRS